ncbi:MAG TPA: helix-turn-helix domain-containing protein [Solirubrobacteraceae bacterium]|jgi:DNA-binding HxlR family transcriptional regulator|nr:helix-turn-helix domain-containing protein [Solirubrobacteraceae bacterium]
MPLQSTYDGQECSVAAALELIGERWTLLIVREALLGVHRFDEIQGDLGIARNVLQSRLERLLANGILERRPYRDRPERFEYHLTATGLDLWPVVVALMHWGDKHAGLPGGPPVTIEHRDCGGAMDAHRTCSECGMQLGPNDVWARPGASVSPDHPLHRRARRAQTEA